MRHTRGRQPPQFGIDQRQKLLGRAFFAATDRLKNLRDFSSFSHDAWLYMPAKTAIQDKALAVQCGGGRSLKFSNGCGSGRALSFSKPKNFGEDWKVPAHYGRNEHKFSTIGLKRPCRSPAGRMAGGCDRRTQCASTRLPANDCV